MVRDYLRIRKDGRHIPLDSNGATVESHQHNGQGTIAAGRTNKQVNRKRKAYSPVHSVQAARHTLIVRLSPPLLLSRHKYTRKPEEWTPS